MPEIDLRWIQDQAHWFFWAAGTALITAGLWPRRSERTNHSFSSKPPAPGQPSLALTTPSPGSIPAESFWATEEIPAQPPRKSPAACYREIQSALAEDTAPPTEAAYLGLGKSVLDGRIHASLWPATEPVYVLGDIHGDFFALSYLADQILQKEEKLNLLFLGDLVDRGPHSTECLVLLDRLARHGKVLWLAGNHDLSLSWSQNRGIFRSRVEPAEYCDELNLAATREVRRNWARHLIDLAPSLPRAFLHSSGTLFTHGGFPLEDLRARRPDDPGLLSRWLEDEKCLSDFTWTRITRHPRKIPNRETLGSAYGYLDFDDFCAALAPWAEIQSLVAGHQHCPEGFDAHPSWKKHPALTLTGFGFAEHVAYQADYRSYLTALRLHPDGSRRLLKFAVHSSAFSDFMKAALPHASK